MKIRIDRRGSNEEVRSFDAWSTTFSSHWKVDVERDASLAVRELDPSAIDLEVLVEGRFDNTREANRVLKARLHELADAGRTFLDARVAVALLTQGAFPDRWVPLADADSFHPDSGAIRFDGTIFRNFTGERVVMAPFFTRGRWHGGTVDYRFRRESVVSSSGAPVFLRAYTAVV